MAAIIRVKRRIDDDPLDAFILNCKIPKIDAKNVSFDKQSQTVAKYAGTFEDQESILHQVKGLTKDKSKEILSKIRSSTIISKNRHDHKKNSQENRFKIINCYRPINDKDFDNAHTETDDVNGASGSNYCTSSSSNNCIAAVVEVEKDEQITKNDEHDKNQSDMFSFVYDLYFTEHTDTVNREFNLDHLVSVSPFDEIMFDAYRDEAFLNLSDNESDDSNDENNWRNEYPDTDDDYDDCNDSSVNDEEIRQAVDELDVDDERCLSSDAEDEAYFRHFIDTTNENFVQDIDSFRSDNYGLAYNKYKARILNECRDINDSDYSDDQDN